MTPTFWQRWWGDRPVAVGESAPAPVAAPNRGEMVGAALLLLVWVAVMMRYPDYPAADLGPSWSMALGQFLADGRQWGTEVVYTFGPLGVLYANTYYGGNVGTLVLGQVLLALLLGVVFLRSARGLGAGARLAYLAYLLLLCSPPAMDALYLMAVLLIGSELLRCETLRGRAALWPLLLVQALLASIKFTFFLLTAGVLVVVVLHALWRGRGRLAAGLVLGQLAGLLLVWVACRQNPLHLPAYVAHSWAIGQGYQQVMGLPTPEAPFWLALAVLLCLGVYALHHLLTALDKPRAAAQAALLAGFVFVIWKQGFVRADPHMFTFFVGALLPVFAFPVLLDEPPTRRALPRLLLLAAGASALLGCYAAGEATGWTHICRNAAARLEGRLWQQVDLLGQSDALATPYRAALEQQRTLLALPRTAAVVGQASVDVVGNDLAAALLGPFNYQPSPVMQSFSAYTPALAQLNDDYYHSARAPAFVLLKIEGFDDHYPMLDNARVLRTLAYQYEYVHSEGSYQLWRRRAAPTASTRAEGDPVVTHCPLGQPVALGALAAAPVWATVTITPTLLGRLRATLYKPPTLTLEIEDTQGQRAQYRLVAPAAAGGFLLNPLIADNADFQGFASNVGYRQVRTFTVTVAAADRACYQPEMQVTLAPLPPLPPLSPTAGQQRLDALLWMLPTRPVALRCTARPTAVTVGDQTAVCLRGASELVLTVPPGATRISGAFGAADVPLVAGATPAATFRIRWQGEPAVVLSEQRLDPAQVAADRGLHPFHFALSAPAGGTLLLQVTPAAEGPCDWPVWAAVQVE